VCCFILVSGRHNGFGVYLSPDGEKYSGYWLSGRKHGSGRYTFANGDFYDGNNLIELCLELFMIFSLSTIVCNLKKANFEWIRLTALACIIT